MPSLGADMEAGTLVEWLKKAGDVVRRGDIVAVVETEKGAIEVEIFEDGRLDQLLVQPGAKVPVGTPLAMVVGEGQAPSRVPLPPAPAEPAPAKAEPAPEIAAPPPVAAPRGGVHASPAARRLAQERAVDLGQVKGTGPGGAIQRQDVLDSHPQRQERKGLDLGQMRRAIAAAMARSKREIPHYYLSHSIDVGPAQDWLEAYNAAQKPENRLLFGALTMRAVALALRDYPEFNGFYTGEGYQPSQAVHLGMAIAIRGGGLAAPAIHDTDRLPLPDLMAKMRDLVGRVRRGGFRASELSDPTATVSSLGERGVEAMLPIIYPPQVAIVGLGAVQDRPWVHDGQVRPRPVLTATLAADHRVSDGHRGALLLLRIAEYLNLPEEL